VEAHPPDALEVARADAEGRTIQQVDNCCAGSGRGVARRRRRGDGVGAPGGERRGQADARPIWTHGPLKHERIRKPGAGPNLELTCGGAAAWDAASSTPS